MLQTDWLCPIFIGQFIWVVNFRKHTTHARTHTHTHHSQSHTRTHTHTQSRTHTTQWTWENSWDNQSINWFNQLIASFAADDFFRVSNPRIYPLYSKPFFNSIKLAPCILSPFLYKNSYNFWWYFIELEFNNIINKKMCRFFRLEKWYQIFKNVNGYIVSIDMVNFRCGINSSIPATCSSQFIDLENYQCHDCLC